MLKETPDGVLITIKVIPKSSKNQIVGWHGEILRIKIAAVPEKGEANRTLIKYLSQILDIPQKDIQIMRGETSPLKTLLIKEKRLKDLNFNF